MMPVSDSLELNPYFHAVYNLQTQTKKVNKKEVNEMGIKEMFGLGNGGRHRHEAMYSQKKLEKLGIKERVPYTNGELEGERLGMKMTGFKGNFIRYVKEKERLHFYFEQQNPKESLDVCTLVLCNEDLRW